MSDTSLLKQYKLTHSADFLLGLPNFLIRNRYYIVKYIFNNLWFKLFPLIEAREPYFLHYISAQCQNIVLYVSLNKVKLEKELFSILPLCKVLNFFLSYMKSMLTLLLVPFQAYNWHWTDRA